MPPTVRVVEDVDVDGIGRLCRSEEGRLKSGFGVTGWSVFGVLMVVLAIYVNDNQARG